MRQLNELRVPVSKDDHQQGSEDAPITIVEYGDYQCPYCGHAYTVFKQLQREFGDDLRFVFRNFPLVIQHPVALDAARAAEAASLQGKFWEMHDALYENQDSLDDESLLEHAARLGLDMERFAMDIEKDEITDRIENDLQSGARSGVNGTPGIFINGERYDGDWSFPSLESVLAHMLRKAA